MMDFEQGTQLIANATFIGAMLFSVVIILSIILKTKNKSVLWFLSQVIFLSISFYYFNQLVFIDRGVPAPMISEENTWISYPLVISLIMSQLSMIIGLIKIKK
jgi:hypothetical protein